MGSNFCNVCRLEYRGEHACPVGSGVQTKCDVCGMYAGHEASVHVAKSYTPPLTGDDFESVGLRKPTKDEFIDFGTVEMHDASIPSIAAVMPRVYLAGPMAGIEDYNFPAFFAAAKRLRSAEHTSELQSPSTI